MADHAPPSPMPLPDFDRVVACNLAHWQGRVQALPEAHYAPLAVEQGNLLRAVEFGQRLPSTRAATLQLLRQLTFLIDSWGTWPDWEPTIQALLADCPEPTAQAQLLEMAGLAARRRGRPVMAQTHYQAALKRWQDLGNWYEVGRLQHGLCEVYLSQRHYEVAAASGQEALDIFVELGCAQAPQAAVTHSVLGRVAMAQEHWAEAEAHLHTAIDIWRTQGGGVALARALSACAQVALAQQQVPEALALGQEALAVLATTTNELERLTTLNTLGTIFFAQKQWAEAEQYFLQADTAWLRQSAYFTLRGAVTNNLGNVYLQQGRLAEAVAYLQGAVQLFEQVQDDFNLAEALGTLGEALALQRERAAAQAAYIRALRLLERYPTHPQAQRLQAQYAAQAQALNKED